MGGRSAHVHISAVHVFCTFLEFLLAWIPVKLIAAEFDDRSAIASALLRVL